MTYLALLSDWVHQSNLLLQARPNTTRITTKYRHPPPPSESKKRKRDHNATSEQASSSPPHPPTTTATTSTATKPDPSAPGETQQFHGTLVLKTYDPVSGACLKYETRQAAEVGKLIREVGGMGRGMAGLPAKLVEDTTLGDAKAKVEEGDGKKAALKQEPPGPSSLKDGKSGESQGGRKKKKKGRR